MLVEGVRCRGESIVSGIVIGTPQSLVSATGEEFNEAASIDVVGSGFKQHNALALTGKLPGRDRPANPTTDNDYVRVRFGHQFSGG
jgi:hypothetical protein